MSNFDQTFESTRLAMLAKQHPDIVKKKGKVVFRAEDDVFDQATESGFKLLLMQLIDIFIQYRGQCNQFPRKEGVVRFRAGEISIEWLPDGSTHLSERDS
ncbi:MAG: hypothetical protein IBX56_14335 [Methylomicrobium sp.]|nr:hypothetical protein [Methylomicrobium sp.]